MRRATGTICAVLSAALLAPSLPAATKQARVIILGNEEFSDVLFIDSARFAVNDAKLMESLFGSGKLAFDYGSGAVRTRTEISYAAAKNALREAITGALATETLYIVISGRGIAFPLWDQGFVFFRDSRFEKPQSTALSIRQIKEWIEVSNAAEVWVFADLSRDSTKIRDNRINFRVENELKTIASMPFGAVLSARARQVSHVGEKHGIFSFYLANGLYGATSPGADADQNNDGRVTLAELQSYLDAQRSSRNVPLSPHFLRTPRPNAQAAVVILGQSGRPAARRGKPVQVASLSLLGLFAGMQVSAAAPDTVVPPCPPLESAAVADPVGTVRSLLAQKNVSAAPVWEQRAYCLGVALEEIGQDVVARYGVGDQFPSDPLKLEPKHFEAAALAFEAALLLQPGRIDLSLRKEFCDGRAKAASSVTQDEGRRVLENAIELRRKSGEELPELDNALGYAYLETGDYRAAIPHLENAKRLAPSWAYPRHNLALASLELGDWARAESEYRQALQITPNYPYLHYNLGLLLHRTNREEEARKSYERALTQCDQAIADWTAAAGRWNGEDSRIAMERASAYRGHKAEIANALGAYYASQGATADARRYYEEALSASPGHVPASYNLARLLLSEGQPEKALVLLQRNRDRDASFVSSRLLLGLVLIQTRRLNEAEKELTALLDESPSWEVHAAYARLMLARGQLAEAAGEAETALRLQKEVVERRGGTTTAPVAADLHLLAGDIAKARGENARACQLFRIARNAWKANPGEARLAEIDNRLRACR